MIQDTGQACPFCRPDFSCGILNEALRNVLAEIKELRAQLAELQMGIAERSEAAALLFQEPSLS